MTELLPNELPIWSPEGDLFHVGSMNPADKGWDSQEGHGLSVSECPYDWVAIARLGGQPHWALRKPMGMPLFLDMHALGAEQRQAIMEWAVDSGLALPKAFWEISYTDTETEEQRTMAFDNEASARSELDEFGEDHQASLRPAQGHALTGRALADLRLKAADIQQCPDLAALLWVERCTDLDGAFWDDLADVHNLSAPRCVILPARLPGWSSEIVRQPRSRFAPQG